MVLTLGMLCYSLIQNPTSINTHTHTPPRVFPYTNSFVMSLIRKYLSQLRLIGEAAELPRFVLTTFEPITIFTYILTACLK